MKVILFPASIATAIVKDTIATFVANPVVAIPPIITAAVVLLLITI